MAIVKEKIIDGEASPIILKIYVNDIGLYSETPENILEYFEDSIGMIIFASLGDVRRSGRWQFVIRETVAGLKRITTLDQRIVNDFKSIFKVSFTPSSDCQISADSKFRY